MPRIDSRSAVRRRGRAALALSLVSAAFVPASVAAFALMADSGGSSSDTTGLALLHETPGSPQAGCLLSSGGPSAGVLEEAIPTIFLERGHGLGVSPMNVVHHPEFDFYYASNGGDPAWSAWVYEADGTRIQDVDGIGVDVRTWNYNPNIPTDTNSAGLEIVSFDAQDGDGGVERGLVHPAVDGISGLLTGDAPAIVLESLPGLINRQTAPSYDPDRNVFYSRGLDSLVHVVSRETGTLECSFNLDFDAAGVADEDVLAWSLGYDPDLDCVIAADRANHRALVFELDGTYVGASAIDMDISLVWGVAYTNGQFFVWSDERNGWQGYVIKEDLGPCAGCPCPEDVDRNGTVDFLDIVALLAAYGPCPDPEEGVEPGGRLIGLSSDEAIYEIDPLTGNASFLAALWADANRVGCSALGGDVYGSDLLSDFGDAGGREVGLVDIVTGAVDTVSDQDMGDWHGLASDEATGLLYSIDHDDNFILKSLDPVTGVVSSIGTGAAIDGNGMAYDDANGILYATHFGIPKASSGTTGELFVVDPSTGTATLVGPTGVENLARVGLAYDEVNQILYMNESGVDQLYTLDVNTGQATLVGPNVAGDGPAPNIDGLGWLEIDPCDACPCPADVNGSGEVDFQDLVQLLSAWGPCEPN